MLLNQDFMQDTGEIHTKHGFLMLRNALFTRPRHFIMIKNPRDMIS